jgi:TolB-like protein
VLVLTRICSFLLLAFPLIFFNFSCTTGQFALQKEEGKLKPKFLVNPPDWVLLKGHPLYPQSQYLIGVGTSEMGPSQAGDAARAKVAQNLKINISSTMVDISTTEKIHIERIIKTEVDAVLEGVEIKAAWPDQSNGVYYALAVVERNKAAFSIREKINKIESALLRNLYEGAEAENRADIISALSNYLSGYQKAPTLPPLKNAYYIITSSEEGSVSQNISAGEFKSRLNRIVQNLYLTAVSGDRQIVKTKKGVTQPLVAKVFLLIENKEVPVFNVPVIFKYETGEGELEKEKTSGPDGTVQTTVHKISSDKEANHVIAVKLDYISILSKINGDFAEKILSPLKTKKATFNYAVQTLKWSPNQSQAWLESITDLGNQIISNIPPSKEPVLGVFPFKDLRINRVTPFSRILSEDIKTILARGKDLKLKEINIEEGKPPEDIAGSNGLDYYVTGSYRMEKSGLAIRSHLINAHTKNIQSSGHITIARKELNPDDLTLIDTTSEEFKSAQQGKSYQENLEKLVAAKPKTSFFDVRVWTDKKEYEVKDKIVFKIKSEKKGYLTMLDVSPNGNITVIFPNKFHSDNFIEGGVTYQVPAPDYGFEFKVTGPTGLERIKAIVTLNKVSLLKLDFENGFHTLIKKTIRGTRGIQMLSKKVELEDSAWNEAYSEIFIFNEGEKYKRGSRKITPAE